MDGTDGLLGLARRYLGDGVQVLSARAWTCNREAGHALGLLVELKIGDAIIENLLVFKDAVKVEFIESDAKIRGRSEGTLHLDCDLCSSRRTFWMGRNGKKELVRTYLAE